MPEAKRSTRDRPAKAPLSEAVIIDTAVRILRKEGLDAVTMRRVAAELDTGPASLYVYVDGSRALHNAMFEQVVGSIPLEQPDPARWREQVIDLMKAALRALRAHPGIARVLMLDRGIRLSFEPGVHHDELMTRDPGRSTLRGRSSVRFIETVLGMLRAGGIDAGDAVLACDALSLITAAAATEIPTRGRDRAPGSDADGRAAEPVPDALAHLPEEQFPLFTTWVLPRAAISGEERFAFAIETFLEGLVARRRGNE